MVKYSLTSKGTPKGKRLYCTVDLKSGHNMHSKTFQKNHMLMIQFSVYPGYEQYTGVSCALRTM